MVQGLDIIPPKYQLTLERVDVQRELNEGQDGLPGWAEIYGAIVYRVTAPEQTDPYYVGSSTLPGWTRRQYHYTYGRSGGTMSGYYLEPLHELLDRVYGAGKWEIVAGGEGATL